MTPYNLDTVHDEIRGMYLWWSEQAPGVTPLEEGHLADLWAIADRLHEEERNG